MVGKTPREKLVSRWGQLKTERSSWMAHWKDISEHLLPRSGRFFIQDRNKGDKRHQDIYDGTGTRCLRVLAAGMMSGMTSPARPWFRLATTDEELMKYAPVKIWLNDVTNIMHTVFQRSNTYRALHTMYEELGAFGTAASIIVPDYENIIHHCTLTVGEYCIATNWKGEVTTLYREFQKTVNELITEFGMNKVSPTVKSLYDRGSLDSWVSVIHCIEPRTDRDHVNKNSKNMAWKSTYFEPSSREGEVLRESGFRRFPALVPRWSVCGGDIYGNSPGMEALGDIRQLQHEQRRKAEGIDYKTRPPLQVPTSMKNRDVETLPGGVSYVDMAGPSGGIKTAFEVNLDLSHLLADIQDVRERIKGSFYADLFLMLANQTDSRMTATEVAQRHEEKLLMLGPVLERLQNELLDPLIDMTFDRIMESDICPQPPEEMQGMGLSIELISVLAQAQRAIGTNSIDRFVSNLGGVAQFKPDVLDKFDADKWVDIYAESLGLDPNIIVPTEQVEVIRQQRAEMQEQQQQAAMMGQEAQTAKTLSETNTTGQNGLTQMADAMANPATSQRDATSAFSGYA